MNNSYTVSRKNRSLNSLVRVELLNHLFRGFVFQQIPKNRYYASISTQARFKAFSSYNT